MMLTGRMRAAGVLVRAWAGARSEVSRLPLVVRLTDVDLNVHLTNSRYPQMMDLGRLDLIIRAGLGMRMQRERTFPVVVEVRTRFLRELPLGTRYLLETRISGRERKALVFTQRFLVGDRLHAEGTVKVVCLRHGRVVEPELFSALLEAAGS